MKKGSGLPDWIGKARVAGLLVLLASLAAGAQESTPVAVSSPQSDSTAAAMVASSLSKVTTRGVETI